MSSSPPSSTYEIEAYKEVPPVTCAVDAGQAEAGEEDAAVTDAAPADGAVVLAAVRDYLQPCYEELATKEPNAHGRLVEQVWLAPNGDVCAVRTTLRIGLSTMAAACIEKNLRAARFEGIPSPFWVPLTWVVKDGTGTLYGHPSRVPNIHGCGRDIKTMTEATFAYTTDDAGHIGDLAVDPWIGDQKALECAAEALKGAPHAPSTEFVLKLRYHP